MRGNILDNIDQQGLDRFCFMLVEREKVNKLRRRFYGKHYRVADKLYWEVRKCRLLRDNYHGCRELVDQCEKYQKNYKEVSKFLKDRRKILSLQRKKLNLKISWDSNNNFNFLYAMNISINGDTEFADENSTICRKEIYDRALNYVAECALITGEEAINIYNLDFSKYEE